MNEIPNCADYCYLCPARGLRSLAWRHVQVLTTELFSGSVRETLGPPLRVFSATTDKPVTRAVAHQRLFRFLRSRTRIGLDSLSPP